MKCAIPECDQPALDVLKDAKYCDPLCAMHAELLVEQILQEVMEDFERSLELRKASGGGRG